jgi:hypothetical protein
LYHGTISQLGEKLRFGRALYEPSTGVTDPQLDETQGGSLTRLKCPVPRSCDFFLSQGRESLTPDGFLSFVELAFLFLITHDFTAWRKTPFWTRFVSGHDFTAW